MARTACIVSLVSSVSSCLKNPLEEQALVEGTKQNLSNLLFLDIYENTTRLSVFQSFQILWSLRPLKIVSWQPLLFS
jgi:hypothetical protein